MPSLSSEEIDRIVRAGVSPRWKRIDEQQRYFDGTIYDGRVPFLDQSKDVPLLERAPCVRYPATKNAASSFISFCLGDKRFPKVTSLTSEDDSAFDPRFGLDPKDSVDLDAGLDKIVEQTRLPVVAQQLLECAMASGTAVPLACIRNGKLVVSFLDPKCCTPTFRDDGGDEVTSLEVSYRYVDEVLNPVTKEWERKVFQYRRVVDEKQDVVFNPVEVRTPSDFPVPSVVKTKVKHGFGFCPVVWYRFLCPISEQRDLDGKPIHWGLRSLIDAVNFGKSQRFRAALYCGDPQFVETGAGDENPAPGGRAAQVSEATADVSGWGQPLRQNASGAKFGTYRKKGAGVVWSYESSDANVKLLSLPGDALKTIFDDVEDNSKSLRESLGHVWIDPASLSGAGDLSGKTLAFVFSTQIARCNRIREDFWMGCLKPVVNMLLRIVLVVTDGLYLSGADKVRKVVARFQAKVGAGSDVRWFEPTLKPIWGDYFEVSDVDEATRLQVSSSAMSAGLITKSTAVAHIKPIFDDVKDVAQYVDALEDEAEDKRQKNLQNMQDVAKIQAPPPAKDGSDGKGGPSGTQPVPPQASKSPSPPLPRRGGAQQATTKAKKPESAPKGA